MTSTSGSGSPRRRPRRSATSNGVVVALAVALALACSSLPRSSGFSLGPRALVRRDRRPPAAASSSPRFYLEPTSSCPTALPAKKQSKDATTTKENEEGSDDGSFMGVFKKSPGTLIIAPFVLLFGIDLVLNILAVTRRSLSVLFTGDYTPMF
ncbi:hypothetical protein ACHAWF_018432 [Thalassiosira exigua]